jgi:hypothetical protein
VITATFKGLDEARDYFSRLQSGADAARRMVVMVGSPLRYARFVEFGTRRMRGRFYLTKAVRAVEPRIKQRFAGALEKGPDAVFQAGMESGYDVQRSAQQNAPVKTGSLRRSIHVVAAKR